jgi:hypothetical protein
MTGNNQPNKPNIQKRTVFAPQPVFVPPAEPPANRVISVELNDDEEVEWGWTLLPNGQRYVSGYTIIKKSGGTSETPSGSM